ncbi:unnamed protein product [Soboliphyme baturini]|uniref:CUB domain-containing protein n=1 Tax=Soboliphyme baturini TaxID=241478 RepID=A0A183J1F6_9BILA|nr:unnamed protein product [Soboliphyme baturini]
MQLTSSACQCVYFDGFGHLSNGTFLSPNYPVPYDSDIPCILYTFIGGEEEIVELRFQYFQLQLPEKDGNCLDYVRTFQELDDEYVNEYTRWQQTFCGCQAPPSFSLFSVGPSLVFEFHSDSYRSPYDIGFLGTFHFRRKKDYMTDGLKLPSTECDYYIKSEDDRKRGKFFSPRYPYNIPSKSKCNYWFSGKANELVRVTIVKLNFGRITGSCSSSDSRITVFDGKGPQWLHSEDSGSIVMLGVFCKDFGHNETVVSSESNLYVEFISGEVMKNETVRIVGVLNI